MQVTITNVSIENVAKGRSKFKKATVEYTYNGEARKQTMVDFSNPNVFAKVQEMIGQTVEVELTKNAQGYSEWASISEGNKLPDLGGKAPASGPVRVTGSNYETREERAARQALIVRQSSLTNAIATLSPGSKTPLDPREVLALAEQYVNYVFATPSEENESA